MGNHEFLQSAPQLIHQVKEVIDLGLRQNLLQTLTELGHPYGLLLSHSGNPGSSDSSTGLINFFFPQEKGAAKTRFKRSGGPTEEGLGMLFSSLISSPQLTSIMLVYGFSEQAWPSSIPFFRSALLNSSSIELANSVSDDQKRWPDKDQKVKDFSLGVIPTTVSKSSILESAKKNEGLAQKLHLEQLFAQQAFLAPIFLKLFTKEDPLKERKREVRIDQSGVSLGTAAVKLTTFRGQEAFTIKTPAGKAVTQINPGNPLGHIHLSHQANFLRSLSPIEKVSAMIGDLQGLFAAIDQPPETNLTPQQQEVLAKAQSATIVGISHLVRLFGRKTGLPTWKLDVLPELVQRFHQHDSQIVSNAFGGTRKVKPEDVEMMVVTPEMRQVLVAATL